LDSELKISYDPAADTIYITVADGRDVGFGETDVDEDGVIVDTDAQGEPRGYEFLRVREQPPPLTSLPDQVAQALSEFISSGALSAEEATERQYEAR
jgi:uncharacterized protein YuzE